MLDGDGEVHTFGLRGRAVVTSSGVSAGIDMALALIARLHGREMAMTAARNMECVWHEGRSPEPSTRKAQDGKA